MIKKTWKLIAGIVVGIFGLIFIFGKKSIKPRLRKVPTIIPLPKKKHCVSIYELQKN